jgi:hypothetical protein
VGVKPVICLVCRDELDPINAHSGTHPLCESMDDQLDLEIKREFTEIIYWADLNSARSLQTTIGPSELGTPCDRKIAYRLAGAAEVNEMRDPWPAIVGTGVHMWMEEAVARWQAGNTLNVEYMTEAELKIGDIVGHTDVYRDGIVIDYKTAGVDAFKKMRKEGPSRGYRIQTQLYGLGHADAGRPVTHVCLIVLPRSGWLRDMYVWTDVYRPSVALDALARKRSIESGLRAVDIWKHPEVYDKIPAVEDHCGMCPFYRKNGMMNLEGANEKGCPGA